MKNFLLLSTFVFIAANFGCSSAVTTNSNSVSGNPPPTNGTAPASSAPVTVNMPAIVDKPVNSANVTVIDGEKLNGGKTPPPPSSPAPDNSVVSSNMDKNNNIVTTRVFKSDPNIIKVEKIISGTNKTSLKIFLKNGKTVSVAPEKLQNMESVPVSIILDVAGVKLPPPPVPKIDPNNDPKKMTVAKP